MFGLRERLRICGSDCEPEGGHASKHELLINERLANIKNLNLAAVRERVKKRERITEQAAEKLELRYRRFLILHLIKPPDLKVIPAEDIDSFWHEHILDTKKYPNDCVNCFGYFLHHVPNTGAETPEQLAAQKKALEATARLYEARFREPYLPEEQRMSPYAPEVPPGCGSMCHGR